MYSIEVVYLDDTRETYNQVKFHEVIDPTGILEFNSGEIILLEQVYCIQELMYVESNYSWSKRPPRKWNLLR